MIYTLNALMFRGLMAKDQLVLDGRDSRLATLQQAQRVAQVQQPRADNLTNKFAGDATSGDRHDVPASTDVPSSQVVDTPTNAPLDASAAASAPNNLASGRVKDNYIDQDYLRSYRMAVTRIRGGGGKPPRGIGRWSAV